MGSAVQVESLKQQLRREVALFCRRDDLHWKRPILQTLEELKSQSLPAVFFGGTLRSLLVSRLVAKRMGRPRDVDIVVRGASTASLRARFESHLERETRFGGLHLLRDGWQFDVWPLEKTWAFQVEHKRSPSFEDLPRTTVFNLEAIAMDVWPLPGSARRIYSGDDRFFAGVVNEVVELNQQKNPYPELCVVRALIIASGLDYKIGPHLAHYIVTEGRSLGESTLEDIQLHHYGSVRRQGKVLRHWIEYLARPRLSEAEAARLPLERQSVLWDEKDERPSRLRIFDCMAAAVDR